MEAASRFGCMSCWGSTSYSGRLNVPDAVAWIQEGVLKSISLQAFYSGDVPVCVCTDQEVSGMEAAGKICLVLELPSSAAELGFTSDAAPHSLCLHSWLLSTLWKNMH